MKRLGNYCKAYPIERLREFSGWKEAEESAKHTTSSDSSTLNSEYLFLQENFIVTRGVFLDEEIVFDTITEEWKDFCRYTLSFSVPTDLASKETAAAESAP